MRCGRKSSLILLAFLAVCSSLWAFPGRAEEKAVIVPSPTVTTTEPMQEAELQKNTSGTLSETILPEQNSSQKRSLEKAVEIADSGSLLIGSKYDELLFNLDAAQKDADAAEKASAEKDKEIAALKEDLAKAENETGTKPYLMLDGIVGFDDMKPEFGVGLTVGTRIGKDFMVEVGADYMIGTLDSYNDFSLDSWEFHAGIGWMF